MTIQEAFEELKRRCPDRHVEVCYHINNFTIGRDRQAFCRVYQDGDGNKFGKGKTWKAALDDLVLPDPIEPCDDGESILDHERMEDARLERLEVERERKEVRG